MTNKNSEGQQNKIPKFKIYEIVEKREQGVIAIDRNDINKEQVFVHAKAFVYFDDVQVGDIWELKYNDKNGRYGYLSRMFDFEYNKERFTANEIYKGTIVNTIGKNKIIRVQKDSYVCIFQEEVEGLENGAEVSFYVTENSRNNRFYFSCYEANKIKFYNKIYDNSRRSQVYKAIIKRIEERPNGYEYTVYIKEDQITFKLFMRINSNNDFYLKRNYEIKFNLLVESEDNPDKDVIGYFKIIKNKNSEYKTELYTYREFKDAISQNDNILAVKLKDNEITESDYRYYIENSDIGLCQLMLKNYGLISLKLLESFLDSENIGVCLKNQNIALVEIGSPKEEILNVETVKAIESFSGQIIYQLRLRDEKEKVNSLLLIEENDVSYMSHVYEYGEVFKRLKYKYSINNIFHFYTQLPYLENPLVELFKNKKIGDSILGRVSKIEINYIDVIIDDRYKKTIFKDELKILHEYDIKDYYELDKRYEFYIEDISEDNISLLGYNPNKINEIVQNLKEEDIIECRITSESNMIGITGVYEENGEFIGCHIPLDQLSYIGKFRKFEKNKKYQFKLLRKYGTYNNYVLILSRKRLSKNIGIELETNYPIGSEISGVLFSEDKKGFYFNLYDEEKKINMGDLTGYLPFSEITFYPDVLTYKEKFLKNYHYKFRIVKFPQNFNSFNLKEKSLQLEMINKVDISKIVENLDSENIEVNLKNINDIDLLENNDNKLYFKSKVNENDIVFSIDKSELLFYSVDSKTYLIELENFFKYLSTKQDENELYKKMLVNFNDNYYTVKTTLIGVNKENNTIEVSFKNKLKNSLKGIKIEQRKDKEFILDDEKIRVQVKIKNGDTILDEKLNCYIETFEEDTCILNILNDDSIIGNYVKIIVKEQLDSRQYGCIFNDILVNICADYDLQIGEEVYVKITKKENDKYYGELCIFENKDDIGKNCGEYIKKYIDDNVKYMEIEELQFLLQESKNINFVDKIFKNRNRIITGEKFEEYIFDKTPFANGAFGSIYRGQNLITNQEVILKEYTADKNLAEYESFKSEAILLSEIESNHVMKVFWHSDDKYIGEYIAGESFRKFLNNKRSFKEKLEILIKIAEAVDEIHQLDILHLDIKPENIMLTKNNNVKLIDFGSSQSKYEEYGKYGTLIYASPDQCLAYKNNELQQYTVQDDVYSFGIMMYEVFVGQVPYGNELCEEGIIKGHIQGRSTYENVEYRYKSPRELDSSFPISLENIINKCLEEEKENRYEDMFDILNDLNNIEIEVK